MFNTSLKQKPLYKELKLDLLTLIKILRASLKVQFDPKSFF